MVLSEEEKAQRPFAVLDAAEFMQIDPKTIIRWIGKGKIKAVKVGREWRIPRSEIDRLLKVD